jgi:TonB family protein
MLTYILILAAATPQTIDKVETVESYKRCPDGSRVLQSDPCPKARDVSPPPPPPPRVFAVDTPLPTLRRYAKPKNNPGSWVTTNDYPSRSLQQEQEGTTGFRVEIGPDGRVVSCMVTASSGHALLDEATCRNVTRRARFDPALDSDGNPTNGFYSNRVSWRIPAAPSYAQQVGFSPTGPQATFGTYIEIAETDYPLEALEKGWNGYADIQLAVSARGDVTECTVLKGTGQEILDRKSCDIARQWTFLPARNALGEAVPGTTTHEFGWELPDAWKAYQRTGLYPPKAY